MFKECLLEHHIQAENVYGTGDEPSSKEYNKILQEISARLRAGKRKEPMERFLIIFLFVGHGVMKDGMHSMLYNEFDLKTRYYKMFRAEEKIRSWAEIYPNSYTVGIF